MIFVLDKMSEEVKGILNNKSPEACPYFADDHTEQIEDGISTYEFSIPSDHETAQVINNEDYIVFNDLDGESRLYQIKEQHLDKSKTNTTRILAEETAVGDLLSEIVRPDSIEAASINEALNMALYNTGWEIGNTHFLGVHAIDLQDYPTSLAAVRKITKLFGGEVRFRVEFDGTHVVGKYVDVLERLGQDSGKMFDYTKDIKGLRRTEDSTDLITAMIGLGASQENGQRLTMKDAIWNESSDHPAKPVGQDWIGSEEALRKFGKNGKHIFGIYDNSDLQSAHSIMENAWAELQKRMKPRLTYEVDVVLLERLTGYSHESVRIGDTVKVRDFTYTPALLLEARVIEIRRSYTDKTKDTVVLGEFAPIYVGTDEITQQLKSLINRKSGEWDAKQSPIYKSTEAPSSPVDEMLWMDTSKTPNVIKRFDSLTSEWVKATPTEPKDVGAMDDQEILDTANERADHYSSLAKQDAIDEAAIDAQTKADNALAQAKADAITKANEAQAAAEAVAVSKANLAETNAKSHADGIVSDEEQARIDQAAANLAEAKADAQTKADAAEQAAIDAAALDATSKADAAETAAKQEAQAKADLAETNAKAHADGIVSDEEQARIDQAEENLAEAKADAKTKADAAEAAAFAEAEAKAAAAETAAKGHADSVAGTAETNAKGYADQKKSEAVAEAAADAQAKADAAEAAAEAVAEAKADLAETNAKAHADGIVSTEEQARIDQASSNLAEAKSHADTKAAEAESAANTFAEAKKSEAISTASSDATSKANSAESSAKSHADSKAAQAEQNAKDYAEPKVTKGSTPPSSPAVNSYWLDTGKSPAVWRQYNGSSWENISRSDLSELTGKVKANQIDSNAVNTNHIDTAGLDAEVIKTGFMSFDRSRGGELILGGEDNGYGRLIVKGDVNGEIENIADLDGRDGGFDKLYIGDLRSPSTVRYNDKSYTIYVDPTNGSDENDGLNSWSNAKETIQGALNSIPRYNDGDVLIQVHYYNSTDMYESPTARGFVGSGSVKIDFQRNANTLMGRMQFIGCTNRMVVEYGTFNVQGYYEALRVERCQYVESVNTHFYGNNDVQMGMTVTEGSTIYSRRNHFYDLDSAFYVTYNSMAYLNSAEGVVSGDSVIVSRNSKAGLFGSVPVGGASKFRTQYGGVIDGTASENSGNASPPAPPETTVEFKSTDSGSYAHNYGVWDSTTTNDVIQSKWNSYGDYEGLWFFGSDVSNTVAGKTIKSMRIYVTRKSSGGYSSGVPIHFRWHGYQSKPSGNPSVSSEMTTVDFAWGEGKWVTLPSSFYNNFESGSADGIAIYTGGTANTEYARMLGDATLQITYE